VNSSVPKASTANETPRLVVEQRRKVVGRDAREQRRRIGQEDDDGRPSRHQRLFAPAPELLGSGRGQHRQHRREHHDAQIDVVREGGDATDHEPQDRRENHDQRLHLAAVENASAGPGQAVAEQHQRVGDIDRYEIGYGAARRRQREPCGADDLSCAPPHGRTNAAVLQPGKHQERTEQCRDENRYDRKGPDIEMHAIDRYPPNFAAT
jgi:hypothetical protein